MLKHTERPTIDRKRERFLASAMRPTDCTSPVIDADRKRYLRSVPDDEREAAQAWMDANREALHTEHPADADDTLSTLVTTALAPLTGEREAWQRPVTLVTIDGEPIDLAGVWTEVLADCMAEPVQDRSEHGKQAQRALERRRLATAERRYLHTGQGLHTTGDLTVIDTEGAVTHLAGETDLHLSQAYAANRSQNREGRKVSAKRTKREEDREALRRLRAAREAQQAEQQAAQRSAARIDDRLATNA